MAPTSASADPEIGIKAANDAVQSAVQSVILTIRQDAYARRRGTASAQPLGFSAEGAMRQSWSPDFDDAYQALAYASKGMVTKAPPVARTPDVFSVWGSYSYDREKREGFFNGANVGSRSTTNTGIAGFDWMRTGIFTGSDVIVIGAYGNRADTDTKTAVGADTSTGTPGWGVFAAYVNGDFSIDVSYSTNYSKSTSTTPAPALFTTVTETESRSVSGNVSYRFNVGNAWWWEPTVGASYTYVHFDPLNVGGFITPWVHGETTRVQGGARIGTEFKWGSTTIEPTLTGLVYSDVDIKGGYLIGAPLAYTDEDDVWVKGVGKVNFKFTDKFSAALEGEYRGMDNAAGPVRGYAFRASARLSF